MHNPQHSAQPQKKLTLKNLHKGHVAFKVKTTAPKNYLVRPSAGTLKPNDSVTVLITLQHSQEANSHRFMVQAVSVATPDDVKREQWLEFAKEEIEEKRLNVVLEDSDMSDAPPQAQISKPSVPQAGVGKLQSIDVEGDLKTKYDELVRYTLVLEKEKKELEASLKKADDTKSGSINNTGYTTLHIIIVALMAFFLSYAVRFM